MVVLSCLNINLKTLMAVPILTVMVVIMTMLADHTYQVWMVVSWNVMTHAINEFECGIGNDFCQKFAMTGGE